MHGHRPACSRNIYIHSTFREVFSVPDDFKKEDVAAALIYHCILDVVNNFIPLVSKTICHVEF